ncbi:2,3-epoxybenzoyl-CoA dihydrolase [Sedimenticola sp.]|uniref:2,3-epoxybenzoyl-CoA dihydrolase n=1 Tax=Sedimenticola sp. TaxID=1940285 RepID=UPI00258E1734|nr:2,3-epoxybenzoyl-CoA dihydrolase [Sedimenticola sp.]MCW8904479.1 2,3-epoxybenzoyl-CoA dihydrolase [Sedimenticola sp.]
MISFQTNPAAYQHWQLAFEGPVARLKMNVKEDGGLMPGYELKLNSYDLGVDIELYDAVQRLRFEHPEVKSVILESAKERVFCAGANIRMLGGSTHVHKVNFCKFTNETRNSIEDASEFSGQRYLCAITGTAAGGGYELALAADHIMLVDDGNASVSLPEVPLLAVLPGTGGLTRLVDKRKMRRDLADVFCSIEEGVKGQRAVDWRLVDEVVVSSKFQEAVDERAQAIAGGSDRPDNESGIELEPLEIGGDETHLHFPHLDLSVDRSTRVATLTLKGPTASVPDDLDAAKVQGCHFWPLALIRELDNALLHLRTNEPETGTLILKSQGDAEQVAAYERFLLQHRDDWFIREILLYLKRTLKRIDYTSRSTFAFVEPGSCFSGFLADILFAVDRSYMLEGQFEGDDRPAPTIRLSELNFGALPMGNGLTRLETRFLGEPDTLEKARSLIGESLSAEAANDAGLVTFALDDIDWEDDIRFLLEERASYSPDALTGMEANLRFAGPETMETKIFGRLSAWQNWIFQRPNAVGEQGALKCFGTGERPHYDQKRV